MSFLRTLPTPRLLAVIAAFLVVAAGGAAIAMGAGGGGPVPPAKPLATALHDAATAPAVSGIKADITFTNTLIDSASLEGGGPLLTGASGRLWLSPGRKLRLELRSENGDAQIVSDGATASVYDPTSNTAYRTTLPRDRAEARTQAPPTLKEVERGLSELMNKADLSGATPGNVAERPAYTVKISPKHDGGLLGAGELAWDAARGVPLRAAVYAQGTKTPVLELKAENISYDKVPASVFEVSPPADAKVVELDVPDRADKREAKPVTGLSAVSKAVPFKLSAPATLVGLPRHQVRLIDFNGEKAALVTYGRHLGGMVVIEQPAKDAAAPERGRGGLTLPKVSINGVTGEELDTALATMVRFERNGVAYTVLGSVPPAAAQAAARAL